MGDAGAERIARRQLNLIATWQLHAVGISGGKIDTRCKRRTLHRVHHGVYLYGTDVMLPGGRELAAILACRAGACARRRSALSLLEVIPPWPGAVEIAAPGRCGSRPGIDVHHVAELRTVDRGSSAGIPIVSPALALVEFAAVATGDELERAISEAYAQKLVNEEALRSVLQRHPRVAGVSAFRSELDRAGGPQLTKREAARKLKLLIRAADLPPPRTEVWVEGFRVDFYWPQFRLIVEIDGYQFHGHRYAFERDRKRDQVHGGAGYEVLRITWRQLIDGPYRVVAVIARAIGAATERAAVAAVARGVAE